MYSMSHRDKKKIKQMRRNDYDLREVYSFETVSALELAAFRDAAAKARRAQSTDHNLIIGALSLPCYIAD